MCGIAGIVPRAPAEPHELRAVVERMTDSLVHRGPDDSGFLVTERVALGMRRLAVIDIAYSQQPISTPDGQRSIVYNGEVYNYRAVREQLRAAGRSFRTEGDTEVVLQTYDLWGEDGIDRLEGMFAIGIWDEHTRELLLARDWLGQKPIYYAETELGFAFASEVKALFASGLVTPTVDLQTLSHYMSLRYLPGDATLFAGVRKVPAAHRLRVSAEGRELRRLWTPDYEDKHRGTEEQVLDELDELMAAVVGEHLMSEVSLGAFLSGGVDSSIVTAYAARGLDEPLSTFSIGVDEESQSELEYARRVAERYETRHFEKIVESDLVSLVPRMVATMDEPVDPFAAGVYNVSRITAEHVTVALGGSGGDELFAGYDRYVGQQLAELYARLPAVLRRRAIRPMLALVPESFGYKSVASKLRWLDHMADRSGMERYGESLAFLRFGRESKRALFTEEVWRRVGDDDSEALVSQYFTDGCATAFIDQMLHTDFSTRLAEHQLPVVDRMGMAFSLEARNPFLDRRVAEFAMRVPAGWKIKKRCLKYMLRKLGERYLPKELIYRPKQGFGFPLALWMRGELRPLIESISTSSRLADAGLLRQEEMGRLGEEHLRGNIDHNMRLWMLFTLEVWYRNYIDGESVDELEEWVATIRGGTEIL